MISGAHAIAIGYHGCEKSVGEDIISGRKKIALSQNNYDWLGHGAYFWENNKDRALLWAKQQKQEGRITDPFVIGAVISLGNCFDLMSSEFLSVLKEQYELVAAYFKQENQKIPSNTIRGKSGEWLLRPLDCMIIESLHAVRAKKNLDAFTTVRGVFYEGGELYPGSGFTELNHIQICVRKHESILGYFMPK